MAIEEYQKRVMAERQELSERLQDLYAFLGSEKARLVTMKQFNLMHRQASVMAQYHEILCERMADDFD